MKIAIVYDWIDKWGGVERVLLHLHEIYPHATFFTSYYHEEAAPWANELKIKTSFIQKLPNFIKKSRVASFPFYPYAFEAFDFTGYDLVISVTSSFAKAVITRPETKHICYLLTPTRYLWVEPEAYLKDSYEPFKVFLPKLREWDFVAAQRPDKIISISQEVANRTKKFYNRDSEVIYPPFDLDYWTKIKSKIKNQISKLHIKNQKYFLVVSRLEPYKRVDLVVDVFNKLPNLNLVIVGKGSELDRLKSGASDTITFLQDITDQELAVLYKNAEALIMTQSEDFGYSALEAQYFGCPVIAYKSGGAIETVIDGKTGIFFENQTVQSLKSAFTRFEKIASSLKRSTSIAGLKNITRFEKQSFTKAFSLL